MYKIEGTDPLKIYSVTQECGLIIGTIVVVAESEDKALDLCPIFPYSSSRNSRIVCLGNASSNIEKGIICCQYYAS